MNPTNEPIKESEFVFRRLGESFTQFRTDLWGSVPQWLLAVAVLAVVARYGYGRYRAKAHPHAKPDGTQFWLGWGAILAVAALVLTTLVSFYKADVSQEAQVGDMVKAFVQDFGALDILVSNAGLQRDASIAKMTLEGVYANLQESPTPVVDRWGPFDGQVRIT